MREEFARERRRMTLSLTVEAERERRVEAETLKGKIGVDVPKYRILGACNPALAHEGLKLENKLGVLLPCNVIVREESPGRVVVGFLDPQTMVQLVGKPEVQPIADEAKQRLERACRALQRQ